MRTLKRYAVSLGYPLGIGPEILAKAMAEAPTAEWVLFGDEAVIATAFRRWAKRTPPGQKTTIVSVGPSAAIDPMGAQRASLDTAVNAVLEGSCAALVTAPMLREPGARGHTELLATRTGGREAAMLMEADGLRVALATVHVPLRDVPKRLSPQGIASVSRLLATYLEGVLHQKVPRLALLGLNPHNDAGPVTRHAAVRENALLADAVLAARKAGVDLRGPLPADALFASRAKGYQGVVALYHDQGLIPAKLLAGHAALNVTLGLPFARVSPGHGIALDIAGRGVASPRGMIAAMSFIPLLAARWPWN
ncbi:MAG: 4-hydroxythreonine-4-phosphate dehydrogenase PdxA [Deltaproteobacteria bacterium]|nr:4-hydroxythreonine-4-phosphate dehydrogenase PdxA [Deltaproteobacteria bacterium]